MAAAVTEELRVLMARRRISGAEVARQAGMSTNYLAKRLRDELPLTLNDLDAICRVLGVRANTVVAHAAITAGLAEDPTPGAGNGGEVRRSA